MNFDPTLFWNTVFGALASAGVVAAIIGIFGNRALKRLELRLGFVSKKYEREMVCLERINTGVHKFYNDLDDSGEFLTNSHIVSGLRRLQIIGKTSLVGITGKVSEEVIGFVDKLIGFENTLIADGNNTTDIQITFYESFGEALNGFTKNTGEYLSNAYG